MACGCTRMCAQDDASPTVYRKCVKPRPEISPCGKAVFFYSWPNYRRQQLEPIDGNYYSKCMGAGHTESPPHRCYLNSLGVEHPQGHVQFTLVSPGGALRTAFELKLERGRSCIHPWWYAPIKLRRSLSTHERSARASYQALGWIWNRSLESS